MATTAKKQLKMIHFIGYRMRVEIKDGRSITGQMLGFDKHMNIVLVDADETRKTRRKAKGGDGKLVETEEKRTLGLIILRGQEVVSCTQDGKPPSDPSDRLANDKPNGTSAVAATPGISRPAGRGAGLQGPVPGVGAPGFGGQFGPPGGFPGAPPAFAGPPGFGRGFPPQGGPPGFGFPGGPSGFPPQQGFPPQGGRGFPPQGGPPGFGR